MRRSPHERSARKDQIRDGYAPLSDARGVEIARVAYQSLAAAVNRIEAIAANEGIACDFQRVDGYLVLAPGTSASDLDRELAACERAGVRVADARDPTPFGAHNSVR